MLSPEVWNFKAPEHKFASSVGDLSEENFLPDTINTFYYNHLISVISPTGLKLPKDELIDDSQYYKVSELSLAELVNKDFIENFAKQGELTALTINTRIDCDNCACITPSGKLILSLTKESYQSLGLQGKPSHYTNNSKHKDNKYIVTVSLLGDQLVQNKKNADVPKCLHKLGLFTFIVIWEPPSATVCPSSIAKYFNDLDYGVSLCNNTYAYQAQNNVKVPVVKYEDKEDVMDIVEWLGIVTVQCPETFSHTYLSTYSSPSPSVVVPSVGVHQFKGFFTAKRIIAFLNVLWKAMETQWFSIYVQGFSDSPVNWKNNEHHYYTNGDNGYIFFFNRYKYLFVTSETSNKRYK